MLPVPHLQDHRSGGSSAALPRHHGAAGREGGHRRFLWIAPTGRAQGTIAARPGRLMDEALRQTRPLSHDFFFGFLKRRFKSATTAFNTNTVPDPLQSRHNHFLHRPYVVPFAPRNVGAHESLQSLRKSAVRAKAAIFKISIGGAYALPAWAQLAYIQR